MIEIEAFAGLHGPRARRHWGFASGGSAVEGAAPCKPTPALLRGRNEAPVSACPTRALHLKRHPGICSTKSARRVARPNECPSRGGPASPGPWPGKRPRPRSLLLSNQQGHRFTRTQACPGADSRGHPIGQVPPTWGRVPFSWASSGIGKLWQKGDLVITPWDGPVEGAVDEVIPVARFEVAA